MMGDPFTDAPGQGGQGDLQLHLHVFVLQNAWQRLDRQAQILILHCRRQGKGIRGGGRRCAGARQQTRQVG